MINIELIPIKYITGTYRYDEQYPTDKDLLWDIANIGKKNISIESIDWIEEEKKNILLAKLENENYIKTKDNKITLLKTDWDGRSNE